MELKYVNIDSVKGALYNPRVISARQFNVLKTSIAEIGFVLPIIVNRANNTIIAGHQRTRAAKAVGMDKVPCFYCEDINETDEIKFNQFHNFTDTRDCISQCKIDGYGFRTANPADFQIDDNKAAELNDVCRLLHRYGNLLCAVSCSGRVIIGSRYIRACKILKLPVNIYNIDDKLYDKAVEYLNSEYGVYNYDKLARDTYVQGLAQLARSVEKTGRRQNKSHLYTKLILPYLEQHRDARVLDFGCGRGAYINHIKKQGYMAVGVEFYNHNFSKINQSMGNFQIDALIRAIKIFGLFDIVVCDSVLNSVNCIEAYEAVIKCLNIFCKLGGKVFVSGRSKDHIEMQYNAKHVGPAYVKRSSAAFLDKNGFTGHYRAGHWYFQQYSTKEQVLEYLGKAGLKADRINWEKSSFQFECTKELELQADEAKAAINYEFTLPLPNGKRYDRNKDILSVLGML